LERYHKFKKTKKCERMIQEFKIEQKFDIYLPSIFAHFTEENVSAMLSDLGEISSVKLEPRTPSNFNSVIVKLSKWNDTSFCKTVQSSILIDGFYKYYPDEKDCYYWNLKRYFDKSASPVALPPPDIISDFPAPSWSQTLPPLQSSNHPPPPPPSSPIPTIVIPSTPAPVKVQQVPSRASENQVLVPFYHDTILRLQGENERLHNENERLTNELARLLKELSKTNANLYSCERQNQSLRILLEQNTAMMHQQMVPIQRHDD